MAASTLAATGAADSSHPSKIAGATSRIGCVLEVAIGVVIAVSLLCCTGCSPIGASFPVASPDAGVEYGKFHGCHPVWALWGVVGIAQKVDVGVQIVMGC